MVSGLRNVELAHHENDDESDGAMTTNLGIKRWSNPKPNSKFIKVVTTTGESEDPLAFEKKVGDKLHVDVVRSELRARYLRNLTILGVGTNRIEQNQIKSRNELATDTGRRVSDIKAEMTRKTKDAERDSSSKRWRMKPRLMFREKR